MRKFHFIVAFSVWLTLAFYNISSPNTLITSSEQTKFPYDYYFCQFLVNFLLATLYTNIVISLNRIL